MKLFLGTFWAQALRPYMGEELRYCRGVWHTPSPIFSAKRVSLMRSRSSSNRNPS
jgi:hypothetical protein